MNRDAYACALAATLVIVAKHRAGSLARLAKLSGIDRGQLHRVKSGKQGGLSWQSIVLIARAVGMLPSQLLAEAESYATALEPTQVMS